MRRVMAIFLVPLSMLLLAPSVAVAFNPFSDVCQQGGQASTVCQENGDDPITGADGEGVLIRASRLVAIITGIAAVIMIIVAGFRYVLASGDPAKVNSAKNALIYAIIGLIVALIAQALVQFVLIRI